MRYEPTKPTALRSQHSKNSSILYDEWPVSSSERITDPNDSHDKKTNLC